MRIGEFVYDGNGQLLTNGTHYTVYDADGQIEAYPVGGSEPITMNRGTFASLVNGNLVQTEGYTPMG